jgi:hypothetical protein
MQATLSRTVKSPLCVVAVYGVLHIIGRFGAPQMSVRREHIRRARPPMYAVLRCLWPQTAALSPTHYIDTSWSMFPHYSFLHVRLRKASQGQGRRHWISNVFGDVSRAAGDKELCAITTRAGSHCRIGLTECRSSVCYPAATFAKFGRKK